MNSATNRTRRQLLSGIGATGLLAAAGPALAQRTDLRGFDALWRDAPTAINAFFGPVEFSHEGIYLDIPSHVDVGSSVPVTIRVDSAMTPDDYPKVIHLLSHLNPGPHTLSVFFSPEAGKAEFTTRIRLEVSQRVTVVAQMSDGRHLRADRDVEVAFGACGQVGTGENDDIWAFQPQTRVNVPPTANRGDIIPIRALISHPMETGLRENFTEDWIRQRIIQSFQCYYNGVEIVRVRLYPSVAGNPYFQFFARATESGKFEFAWWDTPLNLWFRNEASIIVT